MRQGKFAPITAALLARKGEARPWGHAGSEAALEPSAGFFSPHPTAPVPMMEDRANEAPPVTLAFPQTGEGVRRMTLRLSQADYERLGLIATKRDLTRQRLLHQMVRDFVTAAADEYGARCGCIGAGACQRHR